MLSFIQSVKIHAVLVLFVMFFPSLAYAQDWDLNGDWELRQGENVRAMPTPLSIVVEDKTIKGFLKKEDPQFGYAAGEMVLRGSIENGKITTLEKLAKPRGDKCPALEGWKVIHDIKIRDDGGEEKPKIAIIKNLKSNKITEVKLNSWIPQANVIQGQWKAGVFLQETCLSFDRDTDFILVRVEEDATNSTIGVTTLDPQVPLKSVELLGLMRVKVEFENGRLFVSRPVLISVPNAKPHKEFAEVHACPDSTLSISVKNKNITIPVIPSADRRAPKPCHQGEFSALDFSPVGETNITLDPQAGKGRPLIMRLRDSEGNALPNEPVIWKIATYEDAVFETFTDEKGEARLDFTVIERGHFQAVVDGLPAGPMIFSSTSITIDVFLGEPIVGALSANSKYRFTVDLVKPTTIEFFVSGGAKITNYLKDDQKFFIRLRLGDSDKQKYRGTSELTVKLTGNDGKNTQDEDTLSPSVIKTVPGIYESRVRTIATDSDVAVRTGEIVAPNGGIITASFNGVALSVPFYKTVWHGAVIAAEARLEIARLMVNIASQQDNIPAELKKALQLKSNLVTTADQWKTIEHPSRRMRAVIANTYADLLEAPVSALGSVKHTTLQSHAIPHYLQDSTTAPILFRTTGEATKVVNAINAEARAILGIAASIPSQLTHHVINTAKGLPEGIISGGYVLATGWTVDGQIATNMERVVGAIDVLTMVGGTAVVGKLSSLGRSARALKLRKAAKAKPKASGRSGGPATFASEARAGGGSLNPKPSSSVVKKALEPADIPRGTKKLEDATRRLENSQGWVEHWAGDIGRFETKLSKLEGELKALQKKRNAAASANRGTLAVTDQIISKWSHIQSTKKSIVIRKGKVSHWKGVLDRANFDISRITGRNLSLRQLEKLKQQGKLPAATDRIHNRTAYGQYEGQLNKALAGEGYTPGYGITLDAPIPSSLGKGFGATAKRGWRGHTKAPVMDHINKTTFDMADSKYYNIADDVSDSVAKQVAREINETIEKGRAVQIKELGKKLGITDSSKLWREVCKRKITIYTPRGLPRRVKDMIRKLQGPHSGPTIKFKVVEADFMSWR
ncbi:MAG: hypothetical protein COA45_12320 [Zetaproteobacteria bacterium]|nr:MAG: hypothetical protein COA45_12320 [Zetaproteobacteria bacterium]